MKIGIISDTHGHISSTAQAMEHFKHAGAGALFHCGDIGSIDVLTELTVLQVPVHVVLGNVDLYSDEWDYFPRNLGLELYGRFGEIECAGLKIALLHGDDQYLLHQCIVSEGYDYVFSGHTHSFHDFKEDRTRCINPGTAGRKNPGSCAVLDLASGQLEQHLLHG